MAEPRRFTLDTSAVIAYFTEEPGSDEVERLLAQAGRGRIRVFASFMTYMEVLYRFWRRHGERAGKGAYLRLKALPIHHVEVSEELLLGASRIKALHDLSVADAWIAATASLTRSRLVHRDPEFRTLRSAISLLELPAKVSRT